MPRKAEKSRLPPSQYISAAELENLTGLTDRRHRQIATEGFFPKPNRGQYLRIETITGLFRYYRERSEQAALTKSRKELIDKKIIEQDVHNKELLGEFQSIAAMAERVLTLGEEIKSALNFQINDRLPALNAGLDATAQRVNNRMVFEEIMRRWQQFAKNWEKAKPAAKPENGRSGPSVV